MEGPNIKLSLLIIFFLLVSTGYMAMSQDSSQVPRLQTDSGNIVHLLHADVLIGIQPGKTNTDQLQKLQGNVFLRQGETFISCDSALQNITKNTIDAYGHIHINQADTIHTYADFLHYAGDTKIATLRQNVRLEDPEMVLTTNLLDYDMDSHIGSYTDGGKLVNKSTVLTSQRGYYYADTKDVYFKSNVQLTDPEYTLATDTLLYNTLTRIATFKAPTTINTGRSIIHTTCGYYSTIENYAHLCNRSVIIDSSQQLTADSMNYSKNTGIGMAYGNVVWSDTMQHMTMLANYAVSDQINKTVMATQKPLLILDRGKDTLYTTADTLFSGIIPPRQADTISSSPISQPITDSSKKSIPEGSFVATGNKHIVTDSLTKTDSLTLKAVGAEVHNDSVLVAGHKPLVTDSLTKIDYSTDKTVSAEGHKDSVLVAGDKHLVTENLTKVDSSSHKTVSAEAQKDSLLVAGNKQLAIDSLTKIDSSSRKTDTTELRYVIAYHHVKLFSDSLQGVADSLYYSDIDSTFRFYKDPVLWTGSTELNGDTIVLVTKNQQANQLLLKQNALIINQAGPGLYNQIKGNVITGYFKDDNVMDWMSVNGNAETMYYAQDDSGRFVGGNHATSAIMHLYFKDQGLNKVVMLKDVDGTFSNPNKVPEENRKLKGFKWEDNRRPKVKAELME